MRQVSKSDISIVVNSLERPQFLLRTLNSICSVLPENVHVYDNGSKKTLNIIKAYANKFKQFSWHFSNENEGLCKAWNWGWNQSKTPWTVLIPDDVEFRENWLEDFNKVLQERDNIIFVAGQHFDMPIVHQDVREKVGVWDERYVGGVSAEDDDFYLRIVEKLGFSPQVWPGDHIQGAERQRRLKVATPKEVFNREDNWTYFCDSRWSIVPTLVQSIPHPNNHNWNNFLPKGEESGVSFHKRKWQPATPDEQGSLLNKDGTFWKRVRDDGEYGPQRLQ